MRGRMGRARQEFGAARGGSDLAEAVAEIGQGAHVLHDKHVALAEPEHGVPVLDPGGLEDAGDVGLLKRVAVDDEAVAVLVEVEDPVHVAALEEGGAVGARPPSEDVVAPMARGVVVPVLASEVVRARLAIELVGPDPPSSLSLPSPPASRSLPEPS